VKKKNEIHPIYLRIKEVTQAKTDKQLAAMVTVTQPAVSRWKFKGEIGRDKL